MSRRNRGFLRGKEKKLERECWSKKQYKSEASALHHVKQQRKMGLIGDLKAKSLRAYKCIWCGAWHLTSKEQM